MSTQINPRVEQALAAMREHCRTIGAEPVAGRTLPELIEAELRRRASTVTVAQAIEALALLGWLTWVEPTAGGKRLRVSRRGREVLSLDVVSDDGSERVRPAQVEAVVEIANVSGAPLALLDAVDALAEISPEQWQAMREADRELSLADTLALAGLTVERSQSSTPNILRLAISTAEGVLVFDGRPSEAWAWVRDE